MSDLPPCGLYRTSAPLGEAIPAGRLVYFHNHGEPGPGVYLPESWRVNRARFQSRGTTLADPSWAHTLEPLSPEGLYRVQAPFACCDKCCKSFEAELVVQLGYNGAAEPILFLPEWTATGLALPESGTTIDAARVALLAPLKVVTSHDAAAETSKGERHLH